MTLYKREGSECLALVLRHYIEWSHIHPTVSRKKVLVKWVCRFKEGQESLLDFEEFEEFYKPIDVSCIYEEIFKHD